jgi:hypothetical protein
MVPLKTGIIIDVDEKEGQIVISPLAGLLDINK